MKGLEIWAKQVRHKSFWVGLGSMRLKMEVEREAEGATRKLWGKEEKMCLAY